MNKISVLLVEDEISLAQLIKEILDERGFNVTCAANGIQGWSLYKDERPDIAIIDIMLPGKDGLSLVKDIRNNGDENLPILILTARAAIADVIQGLESGGDDYVKKPFSIEELMLRIKILVKRAGKIFPANGLQYLPVTELGRYSYNHKRLELTIENHVIKLSQREGDLLQLLLQHRQEMLDRTKALTILWGEDTFFNARSMDVYITRLRKYLSKDPHLKIVNIRGKGYRLID